MIQNIFLVDPPGPLVLVNVVSLKMKWTKSFDKKVTRPSDFYRSHDNNGPSNPVKCHMMTMKEHLNYTEFNGAQVVELPYGLEKDDKHFVAYILLPGRCVSVKETIQKTFEDPEKWAKVVDSMLDVKVRLELPRFTAESSFSLNESLQALGMDEAFDGNGHFTRLSDNPDVYLKEVVHAVKIQVDEAGTEAAAATAAVFATRGSRPPKDYVDMQVNRTFVFLLMNTVTKALLFAAVIKNPRPVE
jgi:serpin B